MDYEIARARMVQEQFIKRGITDERVLAAMGALPRHLFIDQAFWPRAYGDHSLPIGNDQTISQPYIVALMTQELQLPENASVLEIGTGSGYQAAVLGVMGCTVYSIERFTDLSERARKIIEKLQIRNINFRVGDGSLGWKEHAPFDAIIVAAGSPDLPESLVEQLAVGGKLIIPVGSRQSQRLIKVVRGRQMLEKHDICGCMFVPLVGDNAWKSE